MSPDEALDQLRKAGYDYLPDDREVIEDGSRYASTHIKDPRCKGMCEGTEEQPRTKDEPPAVYVRKSDGSLIPLCKCCNEFLIQRSEKDYSGDLVGVTLNAVPDGATLYFDPICVYDIISLKSLEK